MTTRACLYTRRWSFIFVHLDIDKLYQISLMFCQWISLSNNHMHASLATCWQGSSCLCFLLLFVFFIAPGYVWEDDNWVLHGLLSQRHGYVWSLWWKLSLLLECKRLVSVATTLRKGAHQFRLCQGYPRKSVWAMLARWTASVDSNAWQVSSSGECAHVSVISKSLWAPEPKSNCSTFGLHFFFTTVMNHTCTQVSGIQK